MDRILYSLSRRIVFVSLWTINLIRLSKVVIVFCFDCRLFALVRDLLFVFGDADAAFFLLALVGVFLSFFVEFGSILSFFDACICLSFSRLMADRRSFR